jgi:hypothetical protein
MFQFGILIKITVGVINMGLMAFVMKNRIMPTYEMVQWSITSCFLYTLTSFILSVALDSSEIICTGKFEQKIKYLGYQPFLFFFILPLTIFSCCSVWFSIPHMTSIRDELGAPSLRTLVDKARLYFFLLLFMLLPVVLFLIYLQFESFNNILFCLMNVALSIGGGLACSCSVIFYFINNDIKLSYSSLTLHLSSSTSQTLSNSNNNSSNDNVLLRDSDIISKTKRSSHASLTEPLNSNKSKIRNSSVDSLDI